MPSDFIFGNEEVRELDDLLEENDMILECESPLEIAYKDREAGVATGGMAQIVIEHLKEDE